MTTTERTDQPSAAYQETEMSKRNQYRVENRGSPWAPRRFIVQRHIGATWVTISHHADWLSARDSMKTEVTGLGMPYNGISLAVQEVLDDDPHPDYSGRSPNQAIPVNPHILREYE